MLSSEKLSNPFLIDRDYVLTLANLWIIVFLKPNLPTWPIENRAENLKKIAWGLKAEAVNSAWKVSGTQDKHLYLMAHLFPTFQIHSSAQAINQDTAKLQFA